MERRLAFGRTGRQSGPRQASRPRRGVQRRFRPGLSADFLLPPQRRPGRDPRRHLPPRRQYGEAGDRVPLAAHLAATGPLGVHGVLHLLGHQQRQPHQHHRGGNSGGARAAAGVGWRGAQHVPHGGNGT